jgi:hypothetical protein
MGLLFGGLNHKEQKGGTERRVLGFFFSSIALSTQYLRVILYMFLHLAIKKGHRVKLDGLFI